MATAIKVKNLSKIYRLGEIGTGTISKDLERFFKMKILKQEDPFLRIGEANDRTTKGASDLVYSLKDINFEIEQGDAVGIIGRNGAGKSTLLKILSRVTSPTTGKINIKGRVASLLEVGTGFHPELTGRENIYLNGAILGMRKKEIDRKYDEIVDFSGVERYIDTPVKRYSSGMYVRLAFAVAAHLESEILIVDEVLAVGDAEFQKKCLGKMGEVSKNHGRTILFVTHNIQSVKMLCDKAVYLKNGSFDTMGETNAIIKNYLNDNKAMYEKNNSFDLKNHMLNTDYFIKYFSLNPRKENSSFLTSENVEFFVNIIENRTNKSAIFCLKIFKDSGEKIFTIYEKVTNIYKNENNLDLKFKISISKNILSSGNYYVDIDIHVPGQMILQSIESINHFSILDDNSSYKIYPFSDNGLILPQYEISKI